MQVRCDEGVAIHIGPKPVRLRSRGRRRSVGRGAHRPAIEPRKSDYPGRRRFNPDGRRHGGTRQRERSDSPARSETLACAEAL